ncbi:hypothetical protein MVEN_00144700 [Mycena venus]|uniref:Uncharacterized protein n=1 Tax=Mycena venus TaxID=2733690 RepID=A0A8H7DE62_9AGAR|nr:hypothetical protein MVEN_00144700 [Mycena venus]
MAAAEKKKQPGGAKAKAALVSLLGRTSPPLPPDAPGPESGAGAGVTLAGDHAQEAQLAGEEYGVQSQREDLKENPVWLQYVDREKKGYVLLDTVNTEDLPKWFYAQKNDYQPKERAGSRIVQLVWFGHPGDSPHDIRARKLVVRWDKVAPPDSVLRDRAISEKRPVWRWDYVCAGVHDRPPILTEQEMAVEEDGSGSESVGDGDGSDAGSNAGSEESEGSQATGIHRGRWDKCGDKC